jgi:hypothetical protein
MKKLNYFLVGFLIIFSSVGGFGQNEVFNPIKDAINASNPKGAVKYFSQTVDINLEGNINSYSKVQAEFVLRDFFKKHTLTDFSIVHTGSSKGGLQYAIGKYVCATENYIVTIRTREVDNAFLVNEISFIKE